MSHRLTTRYGEVSISPTSAAHVHVGTERGESIVVNRVAIHVSAHLYLHADGAWRVGREGEGAYERSHSLYASRIDWKPGTDVSFSARDKIVAELEAVVDAWADANAAALADAAHGDWEARRRRALAKIAEADDALAAARAELAAIEAEEPS